MNYDEDLPLRLMPVLTLRDTRLTDVDGDLTMVERADQFREASALLKKKLLSNIFSISEKEHPSRGCSFFMPKRSP